MKVQTQEDIREQLVAMAIDMQQLGNYMLRHNTKAGAAVRRQAAQFAQCIRAISVPGGKTGATDPLRLQLNIFFDFPKPFGLPDEHVNAVVDGCGETP